MWHLAGSMVNLDIHLLWHRVRSWFPFFVLSWTTVVSSQVYRVSSFHPVHGRAVLCYHWKFLLTLFFSFILLVTPIPHSVVISFSRVWLPFLFFFFVFSRFKAGYPALVVSPVRNSLCHAPFPWSRVFHSWEQWTARRQWTRGEWQGTRIIMSLLMCHAGSVIGS